MKVQNAHLDDEQSFFDQDDGKDNNSSDDTCIQISEREEEEIQIQQALKEKRILDFMQET